MFTVLKNFDSLKEGDVFISVFKNHDQTTPEICKLFLENGKGKGVEIKSQYLHLSIVST